MRLKVWSSTISPIFAGIWHKFRRHSSFTQFTAAILPIMTSKQSKNKIKAHQPRFSHRCRCRSGLDSLSTPSSRRQGWLYKYRKKKMNDRGIRGPLGERDNHPTPIVLKCKSMRLLLYPNIL